MLTMEWIETIEVLSNVLNKETMHEKTEKLSKQRERRVNLCLEWKMEWTGW